ncbi:YrhB domain-containing protein [Streptomyces sp. NPDC030392]|uniref:YrhB domain-containing protein n=1 Tax=Streptomyces sp. NPDC030392 TaxID=3155468 RepID=UPI0034096BDD
MELSEAVEVAEEFLRRSVAPGEPPMAIDRSRVRAKQGILIAPYNSVRFLETRDPFDQLLGCWPILVDLATGVARFGRLEERDFWRL